MFITYHLCLAEGMGYSPEAYKMSHVTRKPFFGVCDQVRLKPACSATETSKSLEILGIDTIRAANNKDADQTARMHRLICAFVVRIWQKQVFS